MDKKLLCCLIITIFMLCEVDSMTKEQMKNTAKIFRNNCIKKIQVPEDMVIDIGQGNFIEDKKVMCYIACIYETMNVVKNNKFNIQASIKQIDMMYPPEYKDAAKAAVTACKDIQKNYNDLCEASYWTAKCMYDFNPEAFIFA